MPAHMSTFVNFVFHCENNATRRISDDSEAECSDSEDDYELQQPEMDDECFDNEEKLESPTFGDTVDVDVLPTSRTERPQQKESGKEEKRRRRRVTAGRDSFVLRKIRKNGGTGTPVASGEKSGIYFEDRLGS